MGGACWAPPQPWTDAEVPGCQAQWESQGWGAGPATVPTCPQQATSSPPPALFFPFSRHSPSGFGGMTGLEPGCQSTGP